MECQECHQRPATLHFTKVANGKKQEIYVCEVCAKDLGYVSYHTDSYSLHDLLTGLFNFESTTLQNEKKATFQPVRELKCPKCELTFAAFKRIGKFGCAECYHTFADKLNPILRRVHSGNTIHQGKIPKRKGDSLHLKKQLQDHKSELQSLIANEAFEEAAMVRDQIKELQQQIDATNKEGGGDV